MESTTKLERYADGNTELVNKTEIFQKSSIPLFLRTNIGSPEFQEGEIQEMKTSICKSSAYTLLTVG